MKGLSRVTALFKKDGQVMFEGETIAAIATGLTDSGIGIVRISGRDAVETVHPLFRSPAGRTMLRNAESHKLYYGYIVENGHEDNWKDSIIDEVMVVVMNGPRSFTGEDTVEIHCHGGVFVMHRILNAVLAVGARLAAPGEFTKRAFLNGRIDLTRAEAVMDTIYSQSELALKASMRQLRGDLYAEIKRMRGDVLYEIAFIESALDDPEYFDMDREYHSQLMEKIDGILADIKKLIMTADEGKLIKEGVRTVIVGKPNVGKSSFMNLLLGEDRAIVTDIAGTTRDVLKEYVRLDDFNLQITDTAGIRDTEDVVEKIGVEKARSCLSDADLILYVVDSSVSLDENDKRIISDLNGKKVIVLLNKSDLQIVVTEEDIEALFYDLLPENEKVCIIRTSARDGDGLEEFKRIVKSLFFHGGLRMDNELVITNERHKEALREACDSLLLVKKSIDEEMPEDFYSIDLMNAYSSLGRIIGEEVDDDLVEEIFSKFCMGK